MLSPCGKKQILLQFAINNVIIPFISKYLYGERGTLIMNLTKTLVSALLCASFCLSLASCGVNADDTIATASNTTSSQTENKPLTELEKLVLEDEFQ